MTDAFQAAGLVWRGIAVWDKTEAARPVFGRFRAQCEFLVWGSAGEMSINDGRPAYPGACRHAVDSDKAHITQKPVDVVEWSLSPCPGGCIVVDPFLGSGTTIVACERTGRLGRGAEISPAYVAVALERLAQIGLEPRRL